MFKLRTGYLISGIATGLVLLVSFFWSLPDGKLHIVFCDVGQGDGAYIRFPDGRDMVVDGGPDNKILNCLSNHMPFWDRHINIVVMTHPQKDHFFGLISVFDRYQVDYFVRSDVDNTTESYVSLLKTVKDRGVLVRYVTTGERIDIGHTSLSLLWPSSEQIAKGKAVQVAQAMQAGPAGPVHGNASNTLGISTQLPPGDLNDYCLVFDLHYGTFDALFTGDADSRVEGNYVGQKLADDTLEVLKVPHHGSRTGMTEEFVQWLHPKLSVISVGKNSYGHPSSEALKLLADIGSRVLRTDKEGDIEVISDGTNWTVVTGKK